MNKNIGSLSLNDIQYIHEQSYKHSKDGDLKENFGIVAILDVLGWKNRADKLSIKKYVGLINRLRWLMTDTFKRCAENENIEPNFSITTLSDTIAILINSDGAYFEMNIFNHLSRFIADSLEQGFMFRGALSRGTYYTNCLNNVFVGQTFFEDAEYAEATDWAGIIITDSLSQSLLENNSLQDLKAINIIKYENIPFKNNVAPSKDKLVIVPANRKKVLLPSKKIERLDYKAFYTKFMESENINKIEKEYHNENKKSKLDNTLEFITYLENSYWD